MSNMRHPNIVQYLGTYRDSADTHLPVLLMELMDDSLTHFLESSPQPIPYHIAVNICHDVTLALSFLHSNNIVHRDLSGNNVLLRGNVLAKVTDFGMARLGDINPHATRFTSTMCPGTDVYMPPEAVQDKPVYTEKIDCFSFGVITLQILTRLFPKPGDRYINVNVPHYPRPLKMDVLEKDRRQNHISRVDPDHPLIPVILDCLKDKDNKRPSAHQLCERVADLKRMEKYIDSARTVQDKDEVIQSLASRVEENVRAMSSKEEEIQQLRQQLQQVQRERDEARRRSEERERQLGRVNQQLQEAEQVVAQFERRVAELEQLLSQRDQQNPKASSRGKELASIKLKWREGKRVPRGICRFTDAVSVDGNTVYVRDGGTVKIYSYDTTTDSWSQLPDCVKQRCSITVINGQLATVGGVKSNELFSLTGEGSNRRWTKEYPPMPTKRCDATSLCTGATLIVAGGLGSGRVLSTVEVMNTENHQWSTAADLPQPMYMTSATVCGDRIYILGGTDIHYTSTKSVYTCSVSALLQSCVPSSLEANLKRTSLSDKASVWRQVADVPVIRSTCESFHGRLLEIGGRDDSGKATTAVYEYSSTSNSWEVISHMTTARHDCFTAVLPNNQLMVVGGVTDKGNTDTVELASVVM